MSNEREQVLAKLKEEFALIETRARKVWQGQVALKWGRKDLAMRDQRSFSVEFTRQVIQEPLSEESRPAQLCRRYNISSNLLYHRYCDVVDILEAALSIVDIVYSSV